MRKSKVFDRLAVRVGDLDHPLYGEERQRDVWNEASAVALQFLLWALLVVAVVVVWVGGRGGLPYAVAVLVPAGLAGFIAVGHATRAGVDVWATAGFGPVRAGLVALLVLALGVGMLRLTDLAPATLVGFVVGIGLVCGVGVLAARHRSQDADEDDG